MEPVGNVGMFNMNEVVLFRGKGFTNQGHEGHPQPLVLLHQPGISEVQAFDDKCAYSLNKASWRGHDKFTKELLQYLQANPLVTWPHVVKFMTFCQFSDKVILAGLTAGTAWEKWRIK